MPNALLPETEVIACPLCGTRDHERTFFGERRPTRFVRCGQCRSVYLNPRPGAVPRASYYLDTDRQIEDQLRVAQSREPAFRMIAEVLHRYKRNGAYLDVGCNTGAMFGHFDGRAWKRYGVEPDPDLARYASLAYGAAVHAGMLDSADFPESQFDAVTMIDTIYLLPDPLAELRRIRELLSPDGVLAVEFAGQAYLLKRSVGPLNYLLEGRWSRLRTDGRHLYFFTPAGVRELLAMAGFTVRAWIPIPGPRRTGLRGQPARLHYSACRLLAGVSYRFLDYCPKVLCVASRA